MILAVTFAFQLNNWKNVMSHSEFQSYNILKSKTPLACRGISGLKGNCFSFISESRFTFALFITFIFIYLSFVCDQV